jgi:predicted GIY-YIG superfamily endonuclease
MEKQLCVYILTNSRNGTLYVGVTSALPKQLWKLRAIEAINPDWRDLYEELV